MAWLCGYDIAESEATTNGASDDNPFHVVNGSIGGIGGCLRVHRLWLADQPGIGDLGAQAVAQLLLQQVRLGVAACRLEEVDLTGCGIGPKGADALAAALASFHPPPGSSRDGCTDSNAGGENVTAARGTSGNNRESESESESESDEDEEKVRARRANRVRRRMEKERWLLQSQGRHLALEALLVGHNRIDEKASRRLLEAARPLRVAHVDVQGMGVLWGYYGGTGVQGHASNNHTPLGGGIPVTI